METTLPVHPTAVTVILKVMNHVGMLQREEQDSRVYSYTDLPEDAKESVRDRWREEHREDHTISDDLCSDFYHEISKLDYCVEPEYGSNESGDFRVQWSLGYCQGDGVAFSGRPYDVKKIAKRLLSRKDFRLITYEHKTGNFENGCLLDYISVRVEDINHHYHHYNSFRTTVENESFWDDDMTQRQRDVLEILEITIQEELVQLSHDLEALGYREMEARDEDSYIDEDIENQWEQPDFNRKGEEIYPR